MKGSVGSCLNPCYGVLDRLYRRKTYKVDKKSWKITNLWQCQECGKLYIDTKQGILEIPFPN